MLTENSKFKEQLAIAISAHLLELLKKLTSPNASKNAEQPNSFIAGQKANVTATLQNNLAKHGFIIQSSKIIPLEIT